MDTEVVNLKYDKYDIYIGRDKSKKFHYGNPFSYNPAWGIPAGTRHGSVIAYRKWLTGEEHSSVEPNRRLWILKNLNSLKGKKLGCFCSPLECHGDVLVELIASGDIHE